MPELLQLITLAIGAIGSLILAADTLSKTDFKNDGLFGIPKVFWGILLYWLYRILASGNAV